MNRQDGLSEAEARPTRWRPTPGKFGGNRERGALDPSKPRSRAHRASDERRALRLSNDDANSCALGTLNIPTRQRTGPGLFLWR